MGIRHTTKVGSTEMAKALGISLSKLQSLQKKNKFSHGSDYYTMATGKNGSGRKIILPNGCIFLRARKNKQ